MTDIDTKLLRSFLSVAAEQSFSNAAERLCCSQATMSLRIRTLEGLLRVKLFERGYHSVKLTPSGLELLPYAQGLIDQHDAMVDRIHRGEVSGSVRLGIAEGYVLPMLPDILRRIRQSYKGIELDIVCALSTRLQQQVEARTLDLAIVTLPNAKTDANTLSEPTLFWVAARNFELPKGKALPMAFYPDGCAFRKAATTALKSHNILFREAINSTNGTVIQSEVTAGTAITVMAEGTIPAGLKKLSYQFGLPALPHGCIQIIERKGGQSAAAQLVKDSIIKAY